jgi:hypothetical protein
MNWTYTDSLDAITPNDLTGLFAHWGSPPVPDAILRIFQASSVVISVMMKRKKPLFRNVASGIARKWGFLHFTLILITTLSG